MELTLVQGMFTTPNGDAPNARELNEAKMKAGYQYLMVENLKPPPKWTDPAGRVNGKISMPIGEIDTLLREVLGIEMLRGGTSAGDIADGTAVSDAKVTLRKGGRVDGTGFVADIGFWRPVSASRC